MTEETSQRRILSEPSLFLGLGVVLVGGLFALVLYPDARAAALLAGAAGGVGVLVVAYAMMTRGRRLEAAIVRLATEEERRGVEDSFHLLERIRQRLEGARTAAAAEGSRHRGISAGSLHPGR